MAQVFYVDMSSDPNYGVFYNSGVPSGTVSMDTTSLHQYTGGTPGPAISLSTNTEYYARLYNGFHSNSAPQLTEEKLVVGACTPSQNPITPNTSMTWSATVSGGYPAGNYSYNWTGTGPLASGTWNTNPTAAMQYGTSELTKTETANVTVVSGGVDANGHSYGQQQASCNQGSTYVNYVPFLKSTGGDVHSNQKINVPGGPQ